MAAKLPPFDKYAYYSDSVQSPEEDAKFLDQVYREARGGKAPLVLREDFCGAFANCCAWVRLGSKRQAIGLDLDPEPLAYGHEHYLPQLSPKERARLAILRRDVLKPGAPPADIICALNFSYFIFKERALLKRYFKQCLKGLKPGGILVIDCFGGPKCSEPNEEYSEQGSPPFYYYWDQLSFDPLTNEAKFAIHFKRRGEAKREHVFSYDWRMWSPSELKDLLLEAGFKQVDYLWEGSTPEGEGDSDFKVVTEGEVCEAWVCYLAALRD